MPSDKKRIRPVIEEVTPIVETPETEAQVIEEVAKEESKHSEEHVTHEEKVREVINELETLHPPKPIKSSGGSSFKMLFLITVFTALAVGFISGGVYVYLSGLKTLDAPEAQATPEPTVTPVITPTPEASASPSGTPQANVDKSVYKVQVLNGSGKIGEAGKAKTLVEKSGFKVTATGNAANYNFTDTVVEAKEQVSQNVLDELTKALTDTYSVKEGTVLKANNPYDIIVTVGSK